MNKRKVEIFSAGCPACQKVIEAVNGEAYEYCEIEILDMNSPEIEARADQLGIFAVPAVVIDGTLADCCSNRGVNIEILRQAGIGQPLLPPTSGL